MEDESEEYGYSVKNPVKVGGVDDGSAHERAYLNRLSGPNGEKVMFARLGSCCPFPTKNSPYGQGMLDKYEVMIEGAPELKVLYLNMYDEDDLYAPEGFILREE